MKLFKVRLRRVRQLRRINPKYELCMNPNTSDEEEGHEEKKIIIGDDGERYEEYEEEIEEEYEEECETEDEDVEEEEFQVDDSLIKTAEQVEEEENERKKKEFEDRRKEEIEKRRKYMETRKQISNKKKTGKKSFLQWKTKIKENEKATKEEYAVAKFLRFNCPSKEAKFVPMQNMVHCFYGNKAVDTLLDSKWAKNTQGEITFTDRKSCVIFLERLMVKGLFHRATKVERLKKDKGRRKKKEEEIPEEDKEKEKKVKKDKKKGKEKEKELEEKTDDSKKEEKKDEEKKKDDDKKKKEKKLRLDMAHEQRFIDADEVYVWIYDPVPATTFIIGLLMVLGAAMLCLFPLWPDWMRGGVYYVSLIGASFVGLILLMVMVRSILFGVLWFITFGTLHFWLLPNLTEDVGFFDSFKPTYTYNVYRKKDSDKENDKQTQDKNEKKSNKKNDKTESESENNDQDQGYEMVQKEDVEEEEGSEVEEEIEGNNEDLSEDVEDEDVEPKKTK